MPIITVKSGAHRGFVFELDGQEPCYIGRDKAAHIRIMDQGVSRRHAEVYRVGEMYFIQDLDSRNGTYVNEERINQEMLRGGDLIRIGNTVFLFEDRAPLDEELEVDPPKVRFGPNQDLSSTVILDAVAEEQDLEEPTRNSEVQVTNLKHIHKVARALGEERNIPGLLRKVVRIAARAIEADHAYIFVRKGRAKELSLEASYERKDRPSPIISKGIIRRVIKEGKAILTGDAALDERFMDNPSVIIQGIESVVCAPLLALGDTQGVIYLETGSVTKAFEQADLELVTTIGVQIGLAMQGILASQAQERTFMRAVEALVTAMERQDPRAVGHSKRIEKIVKRLGKRLRLSHGERRRLRRAALLHNVGKIAISNKEAQAALTESKEAFERLQVERTVELVRRMEGLEDLLPIIENYRERMDGSGTPQGISGEEIPLASRILGLADAFDTLLVLGDEDGHCSAEEAYQKLKGDPAFDSDLVEVLGQMVKKGEIPVPKPAREKEVALPPSYDTPPDLPFPPG